MDGMPDQSPHDAGPAIALSAQRIDHSSAMSKAEPAPPAQPPLPSAPKPVPPPPAAMDDSHSQPTSLHSPLSPPRPPSAAGSRPPSSSSHSNPALAPPPPRLTLRTSSSPATSAAPQPLPHTLPPMLSALVESTFGQLVVAPTAPAVSSPAGSEQRLWYVLSALQSMLMRMQLGEPPMTDMAVVRQQLSDIVQHAQSEDTHSLAPAPASSLLASPGTPSTLPQSTATLTSPHSSLLAASISTSSSAPPAASASPHIAIPSPSSSSGIAFPSPLATATSSAASSFDYGSASSDSDSALVSPTASSPSSASLTAVPSPASATSPTLLQHVSKSPLKVLYVKVQQQYTVTRRQAKRMTQDEREKLVPVPVRIMGHLPPPAGPAADPYSDLYFVARDVCQLIHLRQGSVSKVIHDFLPHERNRIPVLCQRSTGAGCTQVLTVLTMDGVRRLLGHSQSPLAPHVLKWMMEQVDAVVKDGAKAGSGAGGGAGGVGGGGGMGGMGGVGMGGVGLGGVDGGRAVRQMLKGSGMVLEGDRRKERKRERTGAAAGQQEPQGGAVDKRVDSSSGTDKKVKTEVSAAANSSAAERVDLSAGNSPASRAARHQRAAQQQSAFSNASLLGTSSFLAGSQYQQLLLDAQQRELAAQMQAMQTRVRENEQLMMLQQQHRQQQHLMSTAFPSLLPLSSPMPQSLHSPLRPLDSPSSQSTASSFSHALLQHQLLAAYQQQQQPAALPLGPAPSLSASLSSGAGSTGSAFTSPSASAASMSGTATGLLSSMSSHAASFKPSLPQTFKPLTVPLQAS